MDATMAKLKDKMKASVFLTLQQVLEVVQEIMAKSVMTFTKSDKDIRSDTIIFLLGVTAHMHNFDDEGVRVITAIRKKLGMPAGEKFKLPSPPPVISNLLFTRKLGERNTVDDSASLVVDTFLAHQIGALIKQCKALTNSKDLSEIDSVHLNKAIKAVPYFKALFRGFIVGAPQELPE